MERFSKDEEETNVDLDDSISGANVQKTNQFVSESEGGNSSWGTTKFDKIEKIVQEAIISDTGVVTDGEDDSSDSNNQIIEPEAQPVQRKYANEDTSHPNWSKHQKHIFVLSSAGKPIYSRYGDEQNLAPFMASLTAMMSYVLDMGDTMRFVSAGDHKFVFMIKGPILLVCISRTLEPVSQLVQQLSYVHGQVISILTAGVNQIFERRAHFDLRSLLGGADRFLDNLLSLMNHDFSFLLNAIHCLRLEPSVRSTLAGVIQHAQTPDLLYAIMIAKYQLVNLIRPKRFILQPADLHLIMNFVNASTAFRASESWTPLCLPKFNDSGFLHAYVCFIAEDVCLLLISTKQDAFYELANCKKVIEQGLQRSPGTLEAVQNAIHQPDYSVTELHIPFLLHFLYKSKSAYQFTCPRLEAPYNTRKEQKRLFRLYQRAHKRVHRFKKPHKVFYQVSHSETIVGWVTSAFELFATFGPLESKSTCIKACNEILKWIKNEESSLFILNAPIW